MEREINEWRELSEKSPKITLICIGQIRDDSTKVSFLYDWELIREISSRNKSINQYLNPYLIGRARKLWESYLLIGEKYSPFDENFDKLPMEEQSKIMVERPHQMFEDIQFLEVYESKFDLEERILEKIR